MTSSLTASYFDTWASPTVNYGLALKAPANTGTTSWKRFSSEETTRKAYISITYAPNTVPQVDKQYPEHNTTLNTLRPQLIATGADPDNYPSPVQFSFTISNAYGVAVTSSGVLSPGVRTWTPPEGALQWNGTYQWTARAYDGQDYSPVMPGNFFTVQVPEPLITSSLSQSERNFDPNVGSYSTTETDADVNTVGPPLAVTRAYNSRDPRRDGAFGAGWSSVLDMRLVVTKNAEGTAPASAVITYPSGEQVGFARYPDGTWYAPSGRFATLTVSIKPAGGAYGYELTDKAGTLYKLSNKITDDPSDTTANLGWTGSWALSEVRDARNLALSFHYDANRHVDVLTAASNRKLHFTWAQQPGAGWHVQSVRTDPYDPTDEASVLEWSYTYAGDRLTRVCGPDDDEANNACTRYSYVDGSHYATAVLDSNPLSYLRLADTAGTLAVDQVALNLSAREGTYSQVDLGTSGSPIASAQTSVVTFGAGGKNSMVTLPVDLSHGLANQTVSLWFKTSTGGGVLYGYQAQSPTLASTSQWYHPALYVGTDGLLYGRFYSGLFIAPLKSTTSVTNNQWHHAVLTAEGGTQRLYLDGQKIGEAANSPATVVGTPITTIGSGFIGGSFPGQLNTGAGAPLPFKGQIAEVARHARGLSVAEITAIRANVATAGLLSQITLPSGKTEAEIDYNIVRDVATVITDRNGGEWTIQPPSTVGSSAAYRAKVLVSTPEAYWRLGDRAATQAFDETYGGAYAPLHNVTVGGVAGPFGAGDSTAAAFDGTSSWMDTGKDTSTGQSALALSLWFRTGPAGAGSVLYGQSTDPFGAPTTANGYHPVLYIGADKLLRGQFRNGATSPISSALAPNAGVVTDNKWHHVLLTGSGSSQTLYLDGQVMGTTAGTISSTGQTHHTVGAGYLGGTWPQQPNAGGAVTARYFTGEIAEVAVYKRALTSAQITEQRRAVDKAATESPVTYVDVLDPQDKPATYGYDPRRGDRIVKTINTLRHATDYFYDEGGFLYATRDARGVETYTGHDARGNVTSQVTCQDFAALKCSTTYYSYFLDENVPTDVRNDRILTERDGRSETASDARYLTSYTYAFDGQPTRVTSPPVRGFLNGRVTETTYTDGTEASHDGGLTPRGLVEAITTSANDPEEPEQARWVQRFTYYANGDTATMTTPLGERTEFSYDRLGRLATKTVHVRIAGDEHATVDGQGQPISLLTTSYEYNGRDQITVQTEPVNRNIVAEVDHTPQISYTYDADGNITGQTTRDLTGVADGGDTARTWGWTYDAANRVRTVTDPEANTTTYSYDAYGRKASETAPDEQVTTYTYNSEGQPLTTVLQDYDDPADEGGPADLVLESRAYDPAGRLATITDSMGNDTAYDFTDNGLVAKVTRIDKMSEPCQVPTPPAFCSFVVEQNSYDAAGNLREKITNNGASSIDYQYDAANRLVEQIVDENGLTRLIGHDYDAQDRIVATTSQQLNRPEAEVITATYALHNPPLVDEGNLVASTETRTITVAGEGRVTKWKLDQRGLPLKMQDPQQEWTSYLHDRAGNLVSTTAPVVSTERFGEAATSTAPVVRTGYNSFGEPVDALDPNSNRTRTGYDRNGRVTAVTAPAYTPPGGTPITSTITREYNDLGQLIRQTDPLGKDTTYGYDALGHVIRITAPGDATTEFSYDTNGDRLSVTTPTGAMSTSTFDYLQRQLTATTILRDEGEPGTAHTTAFAYNPADGWLQSRTSPAGVVTRYERNSAGLPTKVTLVKDGSDEDTLYAYDLRNRPIKVTRPDGTYSTRTYNEAGELTGTADFKQDGTQLRSTSASYTDNGWLESSIDARGHTTTFTYDKTGALTEQVEPVGPGETITSTFGYDPAGNQTRFTNGRNQSFWTTYNSWNLLESQIEPATAAHPAEADRRWTTFYDAAGQPVRLDAPGGVTHTRTFDDRGNLTGESGAGAQAATATRTFGYDKDDRLTLATTPGAENTFAWNDRAQLRTTTGTSGAAQFTYRPDGQMASRTDAAGTSTYTYDSAGRLATIADAATGLTQTREYDQARLTTIRYGTSGPVRTYSYDDLQRVTRDALAFPGGGEARIDYEYDPNDNLRAKKTVGLAGPANNTYTYDHANRLISWDNGSGAADALTSYGYDPAGNRTQVSTATSTKTYTYDERNRLLSETAPTGVTSYTYSPRGTVATVTANSAARPYTFDAFDQMATDGEVAYTYDALGRVTTAGAPGAQQIFAYSGLGNDLASDGSATYSRDPDANLIGIAATVGGTATSTLAWTDLHDDLVGQFTPTGTSLAGSTGYNPHGEVIARSGAALGRLGYQSEWTDPATGKVNMLARWLDPAVGRFLSRDTLTRSASPAAAGANPYLYVDANPFAGTDPTGHFWDPRDAAGDFAGGVIGVVDDALDAGGDVLGAGVDLLQDGVEMAIDAAGHVLNDVIIPGLGLLTEGMIWLGKNLVKHGNTVWHLYQGGAFWISDGVFKALKAAERATKKLQQQVKKWAQEAAAAAEALAKKAEQAKKAAERAARKAKRAAEKAADVALTGLDVAGSLAQQATAAVVNSDPIQFVAKHKAVFTEIGIGIAAWAACTAVTSGAGAGACMYVAAATAAAATEALYGDRSLKGLAVAAGIGVVSAGIAGKAGQILSAAGGRQALAAALKAAGPNTRAVVNSTTQALGRLGKQAYGKTSAAANRVTTGVRNLFSKTCPVGGHSFAAGTLVLTADSTTGEVKSVPIETIDVGDQVLATDPETGDTRLETVTALHRHLDTELATLLVQAENGALATVETTTGHAFWNHTVREWVEAIDLPIGDALLAPDGTITTVAALTTYSSQRWMYDLTVDRTHTFYVGAGQATALVHNCTVIRNRHLAGQTHPTTGVPFDDAGYPNFAAWRHPDVDDVRIELSGNRATDVRRANAAAGLESTPRDYVWHHHQDPGRMQLVRRDVHEKTGHTGGFSGGAPRQ